MGALASYTFLDVEAGIHDTVAPNFQGPLVLTTCLKMLRFVRCKSHESCTLVPHGKTREISLLGFDIDRSQIYLFGYARSFCYSHEIDSEYAASS